MKATFTVEVDDEFVAARAQALWEDEGEGGHRDPPAAYFAQRCHDVAEDELLVAFWNWPVRVTLRIDE